MRFEIKKGISAFVNFTSPIDIVDDPAGSVVLQGKVYIKSIFNTLLVGTFQRGACQFLTTECPILANNVYIATYENDDIFVPLGEYQLDLQLVQGEVEYQCLRIKGLVSR